MKPLNPVMISGREVYPIVEGGKGIAVSTGTSAGAFAAAGAVGTFSGVNADFYDEKGRLISIEYSGRTRADRHEELVHMGIRGAITQARIAHDLSGGQGRLHMNILWEMAGAERILEGALAGSKGLVHGVTCGAGMPYRVADIAAKYGVWYYPIVSSARAFRALWMRSYRKKPEWLGGIVYEDPWLAGGHNGLSNLEDPQCKQSPYPRVRELRQVMRSVGAPEVPIFMAGGVWFLREWSDWIDNPELGPIAFQFGTRPLLSQESPISPEWKKRLLTLRSGDILLHRFSPTGFYSSAVRNPFLRELEGRTERQISYARQSTETMTESVAIGARGREIFVSPQDKQKVDAWMAHGYTQGMRTPDETMIFVTRDEAQQIVVDQKNCMGCLSACQFSNWAQHGEGYSTGRPADPRSFCIQKTLQNIAHGADPEHELMFAGHNAYRFSEDPFYNDDFVPTVAQLVERILSGD